MIVEDNPSFPELIGRIEHESEFGSWVTSFNLVRAGALHRLALVSDALLVALGGEAVIDPSNASPTGLWDLKAGAWSDELCRLAGVTPLVRVPDAEYHLMCRPLDLGAQGIGDGLVVAFLGDDRAADGVKDLPVGLGRPAARSSPRPVVRRRWRPAGNRDPPFHFCLYMTNSYC